MSTTLTRESEPVMWQALLTLGSVLIGAASAYLGQAFGDRRRWRQERDVRWDVRRMETYAAYANAIKTATMLATRIAAQRGLGETIEVLSVDQALAELSEAETARAVKWEEVLLLGDKATIDAARRWHRSSWVLDDFARGRLSDEQAWREAKDEADAARVEFHRVARADLGVTDVASAK